MTKSAGRANTESKTIDVLVLYTQRVEDHEGGSAQVQATIENEIAKTNQVLENSGLSHRRMRLAALEKVDYEQGKYLYVDVENLRDTLEDNDNGRDYSALDEVFPLIEKHQADLVHLFVRDAKEACGRANNYSGRNEYDVQKECEHSDNYDLCLYNKRREQWRYDRYSVSAAKCTGGGIYLFTHELGHTLGLWHNRESYTWNDNHETYYVERGYFPFFKPYAFGYIDPNMTEDCKSQSTVMATVHRNRCGSASRAITIPYFSNPDLFFPPPERAGYYPFQPNTPMGIPGDAFTTRLDGPVNASRAIDEVWDIVATLSEPEAESLPGDAPPSDIRVGHIQGEVNSFLKVRRSSQTILLSEIFDTHDNRRLTYSVSSLNPAKVEVSIENSILTLRKISSEDRTNPVGIILTAVDSSGRTAVKEFSVVFEPYTLPLVLIRE